MERLWENLNTLPSPEKALAVQKFLEMDDPQLDDQSKIAVLLAAEGVKPVSEFSMQQLYSVEEEKLELDRTLGDFQKRVLPVLQAMGLATYTYTEIYDTVGMYKQRSTTFYVAKDPANFERMKKVEEAKTAGDAYQEEMGALFGFPKTATEAMAKKELADYEELPEDFRASRLGRFALRSPLQFSKTHWQDEAKVLEGWMHTVEKVAPGYLDRVLETR